jgi:quinol-cytochrome oxidoreductase complex cytochrome b subunit
VIGHEGPGANLLKWDDIQFVTSGDDIRYALLGGRFVGEGTLLRFYVFHCIFVPVIVMVLMAVHFWRVRKDGGISGPL